MVKSLISGTDREAIVKPAHAPRSISFRWFMYKYIMDTSPMTLSSAIIKSRTSVQ